MERFRKLHGILGEEIEMYGFSSAVFLDGKTQLLTVASTSMKSPQLAVDEMFIVKYQEFETASQGASIEEAVANLKNATQLFPAEFHPHISVRILLTTFNAVMPH